MNNISSWLFTILSTIIASVIVNLMLPNGKLNGFIKSVFGIFIIVIVLSPIPKLLKKEIDFNSIIYNSESTQIDEDFVIATNKKIIFNLEQTTKNALKNAGFENVDVAICYKIENYSYSIEKVSLNLKELVINPNYTHINKYTEMGQIVKNILKVSDEEVEFVE